MFKVFDYIYYRICSLYINKGDKIPETASSTLIALLQFLTLFFFLILIRLKWAFKLPNKIFVLPVIILLLGINWYRYERNFDYEKHQERWGNESLSDKRRRGWLIILYFLVVILPFIIGIALNN